ncbi:hypothetical protein GGI17_004793, partial [Coemansia sp. S146]
MRALAGEGHPAGAESRRSHGVFGGTRQDPAAHRGLTQSAPVIDPEQHAKNKICKHEATRRKRQERSTELSRKK